MSEKRIQKKGTRNKGRRKYKEIWKNKREKEEALGLKE